MKGKRRWGRFKRFLPLYLMFLPGLMYLIINNYIPMAGLWFAFTKVNYQKGLWNGDFVGLKNFRFLFQSNDILYITRNTILYNIAFIIIGTLVSIIIAIALNEARNKFFKKTAQSLIMLPYLISMVIVSYLVYAFLSMESGLINNTVLKLFGVDEISWYSEAGYWPFIIIFVNTWKTFGYNCIIYLAAIVGIDPSYYEAAALDGATKLKEVLCITIPMLKPTIITLTILALGRIFYSDFGLFYQVPMNNGALFKATNVIDTYVFRGLMEQGNIGMSTAAGAYQSLVGFALVLISNGIIRKISRDNALF